MSQTKQFLCLDIGEVRIGVATADNGVKIAIPYDTIAMNEETFRADIAELVTRLDTDVVVIGFPRNQSGEPTAQTEYVITHASQLDDIDAEVVFQDESLTSVVAKQQLDATNRSYEKGDIDAKAAAIILQDYLEAHS